MTGTITKHKKRDGRISWGYVFDLEKDVKRRQVTKKGFQTKAEASDALRKAITSRDHIARELDPRTFSEFFDAWIREHCERHLERTTVEGYVRKGRYAKLHFGSRPITKLTALEIQHALNTLSDEGGKDGGPLSAKTVKEIAAVISATFSAAIRWGVVDFNPMKRVTLPRIHKQEPKILEKVQLDWLLQAAEGHPWLYPLLVLDAATGCRRGELLALTWSDVDPHLRTVTISKSLAQTTRDGVFLKLPKGRRVRRFSLPTSAVRVLEAHRVNQEKIRSLFGADYRSDLDLVFSTVEGNFLKPDAVSGTVGSLARKLGFPLGISLHTLRHTHGSHLLSEGVPLPAVSKRLGHANTHITASVYSHALEKDDEKASDAWERVMGC